MEQRFATLGRFDVVDIVESRDPDQVAPAALLIRGYGDARTETLPATDWKDFLEELWQHDQVRLHKQKARAG